MWASEGVDLDICKDNDTITPLMVVDEYDMKGNLCIANFEYSDVLLIRLGGMLLREGCCIEVKLVLCLTFNRHFNSVKLHLLAHLN